MPGLNPRSYRSDGRLVMQHGPKKAKAAPMVEIAVTEKPQDGEDPLAVLLERWKNELLLPIVAERDAVIVGLQEELRLERIRSDQADRLHARLDRSRERRIEELQQENGAQSQHIEFLRRRLAESRSVDHLASAIVGAAKEAAKR